MKPLNKVTSLVVKNKMVALLGGLLVVAIVAIAVSVQPAKPAAAVAVRYAKADSWHSSTSVMCNGTYWTVSGSVVFRQADGDDSVNIDVDLTGLPPSGQHGFHVHTFGSTANDCLAAGGHFNPFGKTHGGPQDAIRHVGDLGNVASDDSGLVKTSFSDSVVSLWDATRTIANRTIMIHCGQDDLGRGSSIPPQTSNVTGNAGSRVACAIINLQ